MKNQKGGPGFVVGKGWRIIALCLAMYFLYGGMNTDGLNVTVPLIAQSVGVEQGLLFTLVSYSSMIGVLVHIILGQVVSRIGARNTIGICLVLGGGAYFFQANASSIPVFILATAFVYGCMMNAAFMGGGILVANYFPKRKGFVLGFTTMGLNLNSALFVAILTGLVSVFENIQLGVLPIAIATILLGVVCLVFIKNTPQEIGMIPDNVSEDEYKTNYASGDSVADDGTWTTKTLLTTPMLWGVAVSTGLYNITTGCMISNMVARNVEMGMTVPKAVGIMTVVALIGIFGSWLVGIIDEKIGTKRAMIYFGVFYFFGGLLNWLASMLGTMLLLYVSIAIIGIGVGGSANFTTSLAASVFGRHSFDKVNSVLFPTQAFITSLNFLMSGLLRIITNNDLKWIFFSAGIICMINIPVLILFIHDEHKYNRDWKTADSKK